MNGEYTVGEADGEPVGGGAAEVSRWAAGVAADRTFPLKALLVTGEVFAEQPLRGSDDVRWNTGVGFRYQLSPRFNVDAGIGRRLTGHDRSWHVTFGTAVAFGLPWQP